MRFQPSAYSGDAATLTVSAAVPTAPTTSTAPTSSTTSSGGFKAAVPMVSGVVSGKAPSAPKLGLAYTNPHYDSAGNYWRWDESRQLWVSVDPKTGRESTKPDPNRLTPEQRAELAAIREEQIKAGTAYRECVARGDCKEPGPRTLSPVNVPEAPAEVEAEGMSMTTKILIGVGVLAVVGVGGYFAFR